MVRPRCTNGTYLEPEQAKLISPDLIVHDENGNPETDVNGAIKTKPIYYPSWNPIGPKSIPSAGPRRDLYIERLVAVLCPDPKGDADKFWTSKARSALIGMIHFLVAKIELGQDDNYPMIDETGIPLHWHGNEASFPMFVDWFTEAQNSIDDPNSDDPIAEMFRRAVSEAEEMDNAFHENTDFLFSTVLERNSLSSNINQTKLAAVFLLQWMKLLIHSKNEAVRQRTSRSSFSFNELRGSPLPEARQREEEKQRVAIKNGKTYMPRYKKDEWKPITIYISVNAEDAKALLQLPASFVDSANAYLVANGPNAIDDRGNQLGPHDFFFLLDETPTLPKLDTVSEGPAVGRSKRVSYCIVGQDFAQFESRYSKAEVETLKSTTAIKVALSQNNEAAAKAISSMAGSMTFKKAHYTRHNYGDPITKALDIKKEEISQEQWEKREFIDPAFVMSLPQDKHIVLVQNHMNRPILSNTPKFFLESQILKRVYNLRTGNGPKPTLPMPASYMEHAANDEAKSIQLKLEQQEINKALDNDEIAIIVSPQNISELSHDFNTGEPAIPPGSQWIVCQTTRPEFEKYFKAPDPEKTFITNNPETIHEAVSGRKAYIFNEDDFKQLNELFNQANLKNIPHQLKFNVQKMTLENNNDIKPDESDFFKICHYGSLRTDRPSDLSMLTPEFALDWMLLIVNDVQGILHAIDMNSSDIIAA